MARKILKAVLGLLVVNAAAYAVGQLMSRQKSSGDELSADFKRLTLWTGQEFLSRAPALRSGEARVRGGGMIIDLREAGLDPEGAELDLDVKGGGALVLVPEDWRITVDAESSLGGVETAVADEASLDAGAPHLHVRARSLAGAVSIVTKTA
jgi:hypothetical protein